MRLVSGLGLASDHTSHHHKSPWCMMAKTKNITYYLFLNGCEQVKTNLPIMFVAVWKLIKNVSNTHICERVLSLSVVNHIPVVQLFQNVRSQYIRSAWALETYTFLVTMYATSQRSWRKVMCFEMLWCFHGLDRNPSVAFNCALKSKLAQQDIKSGRNVSGKCEFREALHPRRHECWRWWTTPKCESHNKSKEWWGIMMLRVPQRYHHVLLLTQILRQHLPMVFVLNSIWGHAPHTSGQGGRRHGRRVGRSNVRDALHGWHEIDLIN